MADDSLPLEYPLQPPPLKSYSSFDKAVRKVQQYAKKYGYCLRKQTPTRHKKTKELLCYTLVCDKEGECKELGLERQSRSQRVQCQFKINLRLNREDGRFYTEYKTSSMHTYPATEPEAHHQYRKPSKKELEIIAMCFPTRDPPKDVRGKCKHVNKDTLITTKEISNIYHRLRLAQLKGRSAIQALFEDMQAENGGKWVFETKWVADGVTLTHLFIGHIDMIALWEASPDLGMGDSTYKTNRYNMALLHFLGLSPDNKPFSVAFCFMPQEKRPDYTFTMEAFKKYAIKDCPASAVFLTDDEKAFKRAIEDVLPTTKQLICIWHINKNVLGKAQKVWNDKECNDDEMKRRKFDNNRKLFIAK